jgi:uncharacterized Tic20 family protein
MSGRFQIAVVLFMLIEAVILGTGVFAVFTTSLEAQAAQVMPLIVIFGSVLAATLSWVIAPAIDARIPSYANASPYRTA